jgi:hypothetical protein
MTPPAPLSPDQLRLAAIKRARQSQRQAKGMNHDR